MRMAVHLAMDADPAMGGGLAVGGGGYCHLLSFGLLLSCGSSASQMMLLNSVLGSFAMGAFFLSGTCHKNWLLRWILYFRKIIGLTDLHLAS